MKITRDEILIVTGLVAIFIGAPIGISTNPLLGLVLIFAGVIVAVSSFLKAAHRYR
jgi:hypothetical protein